MFCLFMLTLCSASEDKGKIVRLEELDITLIEQGWEKSRRNASVNGQPLSIDGKKYEHGVGTHATSRFSISLKSAARSFHAIAGIDDEVSGFPASICIRVYVDRKKVFDSGILRGKKSSATIDLDLDGAEWLDLVITDAGDGIDYDHADWVDAYIILDESAEVLPEAVTQKREPRTILTPPAKKTPRINTPDIIGAGPRREFIYTIPVSGVRPMKISVHNLPAGLKVDESSGIIRGITPHQGRYELDVTAVNETGKDSKSIELVIGEGIAKTPPMGWNSWNCWGKDVDEEKVKAAADAMVASGLVKHGWCYINIDDCWQGERHPETHIISGNERFPDMKKLAEYIHSKGLRFGLYTDAGTKTCAGYPGSKDFEQIDAMTYAEWGVDYVKCDWCYAEGLDPETSYKIMGDALKSRGRDIVFSICNWGHNEPWTWGARVGGNLWRTTGDIADIWESVYAIGSAQAPLAKYAGPGHWNDPDMLVVGKVGWGQNLRDSRLTPPEQYSHISLWCLLSAPLLLGCDLTQLDDFTMNLITNDEALAINQDRAGEQAERLIKENGIEVWVKDLADRTKALGIFETGVHDLHLMEKVKYTLRWDKIGLNGTYKVRDVWRQQDMGTFKDAITVSLEEHGVQLLKISPGS